MTAFFRIVLFTLTLFLHSCVSQSEYDQLKNERDVLAAQLEDEKFGAPKLLKEANDFYAADNMTIAEEKLKTLLNKYPGKPESIEAEKLLKKVENRKSILAEENLWISAHQSENIQQVETYIASYPSGRFITKAKQQLSVLKEKKMQDDYQQALSSNNANLWKQFLENYPNHSEQSSIRRRIIQAEVDDIFRGDHGKLPSFTSSGWGNTEVSTVTITNDTGYELTIRYSGPDVKMTEIPSGATRSISLSSGSYRIAASVNAANVSNYAGVENLNGSYDSRFYISSSYYSGY